METQAVTQVEYKRLHRSMNHFYRTLFDFLLESGLRIGDALKLKTEDIFFTRDPVVKFQKTGESRVIHISRPLWIRMIALSGDIYVFESPLSEEKHISRQSVYRYLKRRLQELSMHEKNVSVHSMRKTFAVQLFMVTRSIEQVQFALGHEKPETTLIYLKSIFYEMFS